MPLPSLQGVTVSSVASARAIFHGVYLGMLPKVDRRLDVDERESITSGDVYVWEERDLRTDATEGIERWTDGIKWGSSRVRNEFLFYYERDQDSKEPPEIQEARLVKQTYSVYLQDPRDVPRRTRKWHMVAYYTQASVDSLRKIEDIPQLASLQIPDGLYQPARTKRGHPKSTEPATPIPATLSRHPTQSVPLLPQASTSRVTLDPFRPYKGPMASTSRASTSQAIPSPPHTAPLYSRIRVGGVRSLTPDPTPHHALYRRALTPTGDGRSRDRIGPYQRREPLYLPWIAQAEEDRGKMRGPLASYPPPGLNELPRILPLPRPSRSTNHRRIPMDDKALDALRKQFMK